MIIPSIFGHYFSQALVARNYHPLFNFLFTYLFSITFPYFFIISSLCPYFNLFMSIFIQSYVNSNCIHVSTLYTFLYILIIHKARNSETFKFVHHVSIHKRRSFRLCSCFVHTIAQFSRILRFPLIPLHFSYLPYVDGRSLVPNVITSTIGQENFEKLSP